MVMDVTTAPFEWIAPFRPLTNLSGTTAILLLVLSHVVIISILRLKHKTWDARILPNTCGSSNCQTVPRHLAIVMDGNRRYGQKVHGSHLAGHYYGAQKLLEVLQWCVERRIPVLTVYAFSTENWNREEREIETLMKLFREYFKDVQTFSMEHNIHVRFLSSDKDLVPKHILNLMDEVEYKTARNTGMHFNVCVSYGSRSEMIQACRQMSVGMVDEYLRQKATKQAQFIQLDTPDLSMQCSEIPNLNDLQRFAEDYITEKLFQTHLLTHDCGGNPDLVLRTSGEYRLSNFLLWQSAYSEFVFLDCAWPELTRLEFERALRSYSARNRRFGK